MKYSTEHMAMNLLRWHRDRKASKRRLLNAAGTSKAKGLLRRLEKEGKK